MLRRRINGQAVAIGAYFCQDIRVIMDRLLTEQMEDGGWNCDVTAARVRGQEYLLERRLLRRLSTGELAQPRWLYLGFPNGWHYDPLRALHYLRDAGVEPDERMSEAIGIVESKRDADGRWVSDHAHHDKLLVDLGETKDQPSRWITLRAMRVLRWADGAGRPAAESPATA